MPKNTKRFLAQALAIVMAAGAPALAADTGKPAKQFMIAAANPHAAQIGHDILKIGGTAADAAVAVQFMLNLVEPQSSGIGGGAFMLYWDAENGKLHTFDGREKAPRLATPEYFLKPDGTPKGWWESVIGGRSVGVPGTLKLLETTHRRFGRLPWASLIFPTIDLAETGFAISPRLADSIVAHHNETRQLAKFETTRRYFFNGDGSPKKAGALLKNPEFADTLRLIAAGGSDVFYHGEIAADIIRTVNADKDNPGIMGESDFAHYEVIERPPVCMRYRRHRVCGMGPPTSGGLAVGQILGILQNFRLRGMKDDADAAHLFAEASRLAYADRAVYAADSDFVRVPVDGMLNPGYLKSRAGLIRMDKTMGEAAAGLPPPTAMRPFSAGDHLPRPGTSHFVIVDRYGNVASMTTTIETGFGSRLMVRGFLLNNELTDFSRVPTRDGLPVANRVQARKRPRSSMSPTIVFRHGRPLLAVGSPGGSRIIDYVAQTIVGVLDWNLSPQEAIDRGRIVNRNGDTELEEGTDAVRWEASLKERGHTVKRRPLTSGLHAIRINRRALTGGADPRREGVVLGE